LVINAFTYSLLIWGRYSLFLWNSIVLMIKLSYLIAHWLICAWGQVDRFLSWELSSMKWFLIVKYVNGVSLVFLSLLWRSVDKLIVRFRFWKRRFFVCECHWLNCDRPDFYSWLRVVWSLSLIWICCFRPCWAVDRIDLLQSLLNWNVIWTLL